MTPAENFGAESLSLADPAPFGPGQIALMLACYAVLSFAATTLYVRLSGRNQLSDFFRDHFYLFALAPLIFAFAGLMWAIEQSFTAMSHSIRWTFEKASGKRTRRRRTSLWGSGR